MFVVQNNRRRSAVRKIASVCMIVAICMTLGCFVMAGNAGAADKYPTKTISIITTFAPGGMSDITLRVWTKYLEKYMGGNYVIDHRPGGGGVIGYTALANARPDGYTLGNFPDYFTPILNNTATYKLEDLWVVGQVSVVNSCFAVPADSPFKTWKEFAEYAKKNPGVKWGHPGTGTMVFFRWENLIRRQGLKMIGLPLKGDGETIPALLGKHIMIGSLGVPSAKAQVDAGKLRIILVTDPAKESGLDLNVPDIADIYPNMEDFQIPIYLLAPKNTPKDIMDTIEKAMEKMCKDPEFVSEVTTKLNQKVQFVPGKVVMEKNLPAKIKIIKDIMKDIGTVKQ
jgi:tripartite-type tricarboxylate transporter receptor subunit TctC